MTDPSALRQSPLHERHVALGAKMADYGGWAMPIEYPGGGVVKEHTAVREAVDVPVAAYNISGEYSMVEAAAAATSQTSQSESSSRGDSRQTCSHCSSTSGVSVSRASRARYLA